MSATTATRPRTIDADDPAEATALAGLEQEIHRRFAALAHNPRATFRPIVVIANPTGRYAKQNKGTISTLIADGLSVNIHYQSGAVTN